MGVAALFVVTFEKFVTVVSTVVSDGKVVILFVSGFGNLFALVVIAVAALLFIVIILGAMITVVLVAFTFIVIVAVIVAVVVLFFDLIVNVADVVNAKQFYSRVYF